MMKEDDIDPQLAALYQLSRKASGGTPDEDAPVTTAEGSPDRSMLLSDEPQAVPPQATGMQRYVDAPTTEAAYRELPDSARVQPAPPQKPGFNWGRAFTAFGGGDVGASDARERYFNEAPQRQELFDEGRQDRAEARTGRHALVDPTSRESMQMQEELSRYWNQTAQMVPEQFANEFKNAAAGARGKSVAQLTRQKLLLDGLLGNVFRMQHEQTSQTLASENMDLRRRSTEAQEAMVPVTIADKIQDNELQRAQLGETRRHNKAQEGISANKVEAKAPAEGAVKSYDQAQDAIAAIGEALALVDSPKVRYLGAGAESANAGASVLPGGLDPRTDEERRLGAAVGRLSAAEKHELYGAVISAGEQANAKQFIPSVSMNRETLKEALTKLLARAKTHVARSEELHPALKRATARMGDEAAPAASRKAPPGSQPGQRFRSKSTGKVLEVQPDMTLKEVQ